MTQFTRMLPALLRRTDVVLELRDARLPLTSINRNFEGASRPPRPRPAGPESSARFSAVTRTCGPLLAPSRLLFSDVS